MKLQIKSLRAVKCGPLDDVLIDFTDTKTLEPRPVTLLAGANGSGKTTVLELIAGLFDTVDHIDLIHELPSGLTDIGYAELIAAVDTIEIGVAFGEMPAGTELPVLSQHYSGYDTFGSEYPKYIKYPNPNVNELPLSDMIRKQGRSELIAVKTGQSFVPAIIYFTHIRAIPHVTGSQIERADSTYRFIYKYSPATEFSGSLSSYLIWLEYAEPEVYERVRTVVSLILPDSKSFEVDRKTLSVNVRTKSGDVHRIDQLSSGEQNLISILIELRRRLIPGSIVLIDEIENSLHPAFQHRLAEALLSLQREVAFQLIATSHSPAFLDAFGPESTLLLTEF